MTGGRHSHDDGQDRRRAAAGADRLPALEGKLALSDTINYHKWGFVDYVSPQARDFEMAGVAAAETPAPTKRAKKAPKKSTSKPS